MKSFSQIIQETVAQPRGGDEQRFKAQHKVEVLDHPTHDPKSAAAIIKKVKRLADKENDKSTYDQAYEKDEDLEESVINEEEMTAAQMKKREEIVMSMKDKMDDFKKKYGDRAKEVMYATATKMAMKEEVETISEDVVADLQKIISNKQAASVKFADGGKIKVDMTTANALVKVHNALNDANKKKFADALNKNETMFMKMVDFAFSKLK